jgi:hypothetical protein
MPPFSYEMHEMAHLAWAPARAVSDAARTWLETRFIPWWEELILGFEAF